VATYFDTPKRWFGKIQGFFARHQGIILLLFFAAGYFIWRYINFNFIVWDDTANASFNAFANNYHYLFSRPNFWITALRESFGYIQSDGYRPCARFIKIIGTAYFTDPAKSPLLFILISAVTSGLLAVVYFHFSLRFVKKHLTALFAVVLLFFSTPVLSGGLVIFSGIHFVIPLLICGGLLCYYRTVEHRSLKTIWFMLLMVIMLFGPLYREFLGLLPLLILILEFQRVRRFTWFTAVTLVFFLHALFPTVLVKWVFYPDLPICPVFAMGNLGAYMQTGTEGALWDIVRNLHWRIFVDIISIYPPMIFVLFLLSWILKLRLQEKKPFFDRDTVFLLWFFLLSFLPFLKIFNEHVHLSYCLVPASILLAQGVEQLWFMTNVSQRSRRTAKVILVALLILIISDHTLNLYAVRKVTLDINAGIMKCSKWFVENVPKGTIVITNAHHTEDVRFYSRGHIEPWGAPGGIPDQGRWMHDTYDLQKLLDQRGDRDVYFFDVQIKGAPEKHDLRRKLFNIRNRHGKAREHFYVGNNVVDTADLGVLHVTESRYPFVDPLKHLIPIWEVTWPSSPDLEFDFYRGPALNGMPFCREVYAAYHLYKVTGDKVRGDDRFPPRLVEEGYRGFNLVLFQRRIYAVLQSEGPFDLKQRLKEGGYSHSFVADSIDEVKQAIDESLGLVRTQPEKSCSPPILVEEGYHGYNLVSFGGRIYAILQSEGPFDLEQRLKEGGYSCSFQRDNIEQVKQAIDETLHHNSAKPESKSMFTR